MKKFGLILLSLWLIAAFSAQALAVDVKFSGEYYAAGMYLDKTSLKHDGGPSTAFYFQRLRLKTDFVVSPGLSLITQADIMERAWGASRSIPGTALDSYSEGTRAENENIAFDLLYLRYQSPIGIFMAGYQYDGLFGTVFADNAWIAGKLSYTIKRGNLIIGLQMGKTNDGEKSYTAINNAAGAYGADRDYNFYGGIILYLWKNGSAGLLYKYMDNRTNRNLIPNIAGYKQAIYLVDPYVKARFGPVALQAEVSYVFGNATKWEGNPSKIGAQDMDLSGLAAWIDATADLGMFYVGGSAAYVSGDDYSTKDKVEGGGNQSGGAEWKPCLIMFNSDLTYWAGTQAGYGTSANAGPMTNAYFAQLRAGVRPVDKLDVMASVSYAVADKTPQATWIGRKYGYEVDLTATYKITNNLSYMLGAGYVFTGDYFKGASDANEISNNFMVINKLALTF